MIKKVTLSDFLCNKVKPLELCAVRVNGLVEITCWVDPDYSFHIPHKYINAIVKSDRWGFLSTIDKDGNRHRTQCHYIDLEEG